MFQECLHQNSIRDPSHFEPKLHPLLIIRDPSQENIQGTENLMSGERGTIKQLPQTTTLPPPPPHAIERRTCALSPQKIVHNGYVVCWATKDLTTAMCFANPQETVIPGNDKVKRYETRSVSVPSTSRRSGVLERRRGGKCCKHTENMNVRKKTSI